MPILRPFKYIQNTLPSKLALNVLHRTNEICLIERSFDSTKAEKVPFLHRYSYWKYNGHIHVIAHDTKKKDSEKFLSQMFRSFQASLEFLWKYPLFTPKNTLWNLQVRPPQQWETKNMLFSIVIWNMIPNFWTLIGSKIFEIFVVQTGK